MTKPLYSWQKHNWNILTQDQNRAIPQALLLWGPKGLGQHHFAEALSTWLLCESPTNTFGQESACGNCSACQWIAAGTHPDRLILTPESDNSTIKVDAVREIRAFSEQTSHGGKHRIILISPVEAMNLSAANALLKILEEPFDDCIFLLVSYHLSWVLPTIRSRCQKMYFPPLSAEDYNKIMVERKCPHAFIPKLYQLSHGAPLAFETEQEAIISAQEKITSLMSALEMKQMNSLEAANQVKVIEKETSIDFKYLLDILLNYTYQKILQSYLDKQLASSLDSEQRERRYHFYDTLLNMKKYLKAGNNLNQVIELENLFLMGTL